MREIETNRTWKGSSNKNKDKNIPWHFLGGNKLLLDLEKLDVALLRLARYELESSLDIVENSEAIYVSLGIESLVSISQRDYVHETSRETRITSDRSVNLDKSLHTDHLNLSSVQSELESVTKNKNHGKALSELVRTSIWLRNPGTSHFSKHPRLGGVDEFKMFLRSSRHI